MSDATQTPPTDSREVRRRELLRSLIAIAAYFVVLAALLGSAAFGVSQYGFGIPSDDSLASEISTPDAADPSVPPLEANPEDGLQNLRLDPADWMGTWVSQDGATTLVLKPDHTFTLRGAALVTGAGAAAGTYTLATDGTLTFKTSQVQRAYQLRPDMNPAASFAFVERKYFSLVDLKTGAVVKPFTRAEKNK